MDTAPSTLDIQNSRRFYAQAQRSIPGGVNSPARAFKSVGGTPLFIDEAHGAYLEDVDGNRYVDYVGSWGPMIFGHADPDVVDAVQDAATRSTSFGAPTEIEIEVAELVCDLVPSIEKVRMVNSGTEATMSAARLARGYTGREKIIKFQGNYHGHGDFFLIAAGSGPMTFSEPNSPGVTKGNAKDTLLAPYNDIDHVRQLVDANRGEVACIIVEPIAGNMGCIPPEPGFLEGLREICNAEDIVLIFDEVMTGFRVAAGGAQERYGVRPDLTTLGKVIGGGLPVGAFGGRRDIMEHLSPLGPVYQAGTLSGNPLATAAGLATLELISQPGFFDELEERTKHLVNGLRERARDAGVPLVANRVGGMFGLFFTDSPAVRCFDHVRESDVERFTRFFHAMLDHGVYLAPSAFEAAFVSGAHDEAAIHATLEAAEEAFPALAESTQVST